MLNLLLKDIEEKRKEISEDLQKHKLCDDRLLYSGQLKGYNAVSYTHLDVYKRQRKSCKSSGRVYWITCINHTSWAMLYKNRRSRQI